MEKGISTVLIESEYKKAIKKRFSNVKLDLILYSTPPITLVSVIEYVKKEMMQKRIYFSKIYFLRMQLISD